LKILLRGEKGKITAVVSAFLITLRRLEQFQ
jgi:hypothetical protein